MAALNITDSQKTQIVDAVDSKIQDAFLDGVVQGATAVLNGIQRFDELTPEQQALTRDTFRLLIAAMVSVMNVQKPLPPELSFTNPTGVISYLDGLGAPQELYVQNGFIVGGSAL